MHLIKCKRSDFKAAFNEHGLFVRGNVGEFFFEQQMGSDESTGQGKQAGNQPALPQIDQTTGVDDDRQHFS